MFRFSFFNHEHKHRCLQNKRWIKQWFIITKYVKN